MLSAERNGAPELARLRRWYGAGMPNSSDHRIGVTLSRAAGRASRRALVTSIAFFDDGGIAGVLPLAGRPLAHSTRLPTPLPPFQRVSSWRAWSTHLIFGVEAPPGNLCPGVACRLPSSIERWH